MGLALIVHGGAGDIPLDTVEQHRRGVESAARAGWEILQNGGTALDAVERAVIILEDDPVFDAGVGSVLNKRGQVELDASIMDGRTLDAGAVAGVQRVKNPIRLARHVMMSDQTFLIAEGAEEFAEEAGMSLVENSTLCSPAEVANWQKYLVNPPAAPIPGYSPNHGTVGCVALDGNGNIAAGTSTGGTSFKRPGRVGDSPLIGCGVYADNWLGGASTTGWGEAITRVVLAKRAVDTLAGDRHPEQAAVEAIEYLARRVGGTGGLILVNSKGELGFAFNTPRMAWALITEHHSQVVSNC